VSAVQQRMMTTVADENVHAIAVEGTFDDCQRLVKGMFANPPVREQARLSGVNSINWARIVAQVVYYFTAAVALGGPARKAAFTVPTGNFGDVYAGYVAMRMGLPIDRLVIATNVNDILPRTIATGIYSPREVVPTPSPSMDIQVASNFERLLFEAYDRDTRAVQSLLSTVSSNAARGSGFTLSSRALSAIRAVFSADRADEAETASAIRTMLREAGHFIDPHTAVAVAVSEKETRDPAIPMIVLSTAHPAKFPEAIERACGLRPPLPDWLADLDARPEHFVTLPVDQTAVESHILSLSRAAQQGAAA
jgi:threonine synthase